LRNHLARRGVQLSEQQATTMAASTAISFGSSLGGGEQAEPAQSGSTKPAGTQMGDFNPPDTGYEDSAFA